MVLEGLWGEEKPRNPLTGGGWGVGSRDEVKDRNPLCVLGCMHRTKSSLDPLPVRDPAREQLSYSTPSMCRAHRRPRDLFMGFTVLKTPCFQDITENCCFSKSMYVKCLDTSCALNESLSE